MTRNKLKERRRSLNLTQQEVADLTGITRTYYTEIENGNRNCNIYIWLKIGEVLGIEEDNLIPYIKERTKKGA